MLQKNEACANIVVQTARETKTIITVEEHNIIGGLGSAVTEVIAEENLNVQFRRIGLQDCFATGYGTHTEVKSLNGLGIEHIVQVVKSCSR